MSAEKPVTAEELARLKVALGRFAQADKDGDGNISRAELEKAMKGKYSQEQVDKVIREVDQDADGKINVQEFMEKFAQGYRL